MDPIVCHMEAVPLEEVPVVCEYLDVFPDELPGMPPEHDVEFIIDLIPGTAPIAKRPYRMLADELVELKKQLRELQDKGYIRPSSSPWGASVLFVKKSEEKLCFCVDYRELNAIIIKNYYSLFLISEILNHLCKTRIYIKLDIIHAFNHLHIQKNDEEFTVFHNYFELFEYLVVFFNFFNDSVTFQSYINNILWNGLVLDCFHLFRVYLYIIFIDYVAEKANFFLMKL